MLSGGEYSRRISIENFYFFVKRNQSTSSQPLSLLFHVRVQKSPVFAPIHCPSLATNVSPNGMYLFPSRLYRKVHSQR